jgi:hypothetical protein
MLYSMNFLSTLKLVALLLLSDLSTGLAQAELYRWTDDKGMVHYSDQKTSTKAQDYQPETELSTYSNQHFLQKPRGDYSDLPPYNSRRDTPDVERLYAVKFPSAPTNTNVAAYIHKIYAISRLQKRHLNSDPQVSLLMQVGNEFLPVLIRETYSHVGWHSYGIEVIKRLATEKHKPQIKSALKAYSKYAKVIYAQGWHHEFQATLIQGLRNNRGYVPAEWIVALVEIDGEDARAVLLEYFKYGWNNHITYLKIAGLPGINEALDKAIPVAWETASQNNKYALGDLTPKALELGYLPAFKFVMNSLLDNAGIAKHSFDAHSLAKRYTSQTGSTEEIFNWYKNNMTNIRFDGQQRLFVSSG